MEDKVNYTLVGVFVLALGAALVAGVLWLAAGSFGQKRYETFESIIEESVSGLNVDAPVKYLGVDVGKVRQIRLDPKNPKHVQLQLLIERGTPIKQDTLAVLRTQGLTGIAYVELSGGSVDSPPLVASVDGELPSIRSRPSLTSRLESELTTVLANLNRTSVSLTAALDPDNRAQLKQILASTAELTQALAAQKQALGAGIADAARTAHNTARASEQVAPMLARLSASADAVATMADTVARTGSSAGRTVDAASDSIRQFNSATLPELERLLAEMNALAGSLRRLSEQTERDPSSLLQGNRSLRPGPGESIKEGARP
jgi:phospholipid/cholesterol/gamma-HCH transport system substrate-binding protein